MDDIASKINNILNSEEGMAQIQNMAKALGLSDNPPSTMQQNQSESHNNNNNNNNNQSDNDNNQDFGKTLANLMSSMGGGNDNNNQQNTDTPNIDLGVIMKIQKAMSAFNASNKNVDLLRALKPHFSEERRKKVDDAIKIMQLINMLPMLKESGIFGLLGGEKK